MKGRFLMTVHRRDLLRLAIATTAAATTGTLASEAVAAEPLGGPNKRKSRYQANSAEVQDFYRVNSYPAQ
jgi:hypothetical protein